jgi:hypothetical protein
MTRIGREIRMLEEYYLEGDATSHQRVLRDGLPDWDLDVVASSRGALLFALDLAYQPHPERRIFEFGPPRAVQFNFPLPAYTRAPVEVFRVDADGLTQVEHSVQDGRIKISDSASRIAIYVAAASSSEMDRIEARRMALVAGEESINFNPAASPNDLAVLRELAKKQQP